MIRHKDRQTVQRARSAYFFIRRHRHASPVTAGAGAADQSIA
jgi:hypothetical protein